MPRSIMYWASSPKPAQVSTGWLQVSVNFSGSSSAVGLSVWPCSTRCIERQEQGMTQITSLCSMIWR